MFPGRNILSFLPKNYFCKKFRFDVLRSGLQRQHLCAVVHVGKTSTGKVGPNKSITYCKALTTEIGTPSLMDPLVRCARAVKRK